MIFKRCHTDLPDIPSYSDRCLSLNLQTLKLRHDIFDLTFFHNLRLHPDLISTKNLPQPKCHRFSLRNKSPFLHPHVRTTLRRNSFFVRTLKTYNTIVGNTINLILCTYFQIYVICTLASLLYMQ
jgi:hypothetical protein